MGVNPLVNRTANIAMGYECLNHTRYTCKQPIHYNRFHMYRMKLSDSEKTMNEEDQDVMGVGMWQR